MLAKLQIFRECPYPEAIGRVSYNMSHLLHQESRKKCTGQILFSLEDSIYYTIAPTSFDMYDYVEEELLWGYNGADVFAGEITRRDILALNQNQVGPIPTTRVVHG